MNPTIRSLQWTDILPTITQRTSTFLHYHPNKQLRITTILLLKNSSIACHLQAISVNSNILLIPLASVGWPLKLPDYEYRILNWNKRSKDLNSQVLFLKIMTIPIDLSFRSTSSTYPTQKQITILWEDKIVNFENKQKLVNHSREGLTHSKRRNMLWSRTWDSRWNRTLIFNRYTKKISITPHKGFMSSSWRKTTSISLARTRDSLLSLLKGSRTHLYDTT